MKRTIVILIVMLSTCVYSQESKERNWGIKINPVQLIDIASFPTLQLSVERKINYYSSLNIEIGYQLYDVSNTDTIFFKDKGFKTNIEGRIYLQKLFNSRVKSKRSELYAGIQVFYRENQRNSFIEYVPIDPINEDEYLDDFGVKKTAKGINLTVGNQFSFARFILEPFVVFGYMYRNTTNTDLDYDESKHSLSMNHAFFLGSDLESNSGSMFNFGLGCRVGLRF
ncbi:DUF3575 domain-containing protein [Flavobacterium chungangense]|uniref:DUF3575 domain-containing protein n=1 Tax=Flavobacterium chungangense TaxID=554283 RepID=A0A6V6ZB77_9FLAO|nr:DUF3575 domain-containing protein [Flavobacterium chungangense]CAD0008182.1 hypothetical protein FLACHUCJ7_03664 [Flavobacterium chungangense]